MNMRPVLFATLIAAATLTLSGCADPEPTMEECWGHHMSLLQDHVFGADLADELNSRGCGEYLRQVTDVPNHQEQGSCTLDANNEMYCEGK